MKFYTEYNSFYLTPAVKLYYDKYYEGDLIFLDLEITWLIWTIGFNIIKEKS
jgi:hypothetical protein